MKVKDVEMRVQRIREIAADDESAHGEEDQLHQDVLAEIVRQGKEPEDGASSPFALAEAALKTVEIEFARWCA